LQLVRTGDLLAGEAELKKALDDAVGKVKDAARGLCRPRRAHPSNRGENTDILLES
jgi:hypothetical protein